MDWQTVFIVIGGAAFAMLVGWCRWLTARVGQTVEQLAAYKLEVAKEYASVPHLKDVEQRLVNELTNMSRQLGRLADAVAHLRGQRGLHHDFDDGQG